MIVRAQGSGPQARSALETLVRRYERTVEQMLLRYRPPRELCIEDLRQDFFTDFLRCEDVLKLDRERGKFRTWLHVAIRRFVAKRWRTWFREHPVDGVSAAQACEVIRRTDERGEEELHVVDRDTPDHAFLRRFAADTLLQAIERHRAEAPDKDLFERLLRYLPGPAMSVEALSPLAAELEMRPGTLAVRIHRMQKRHRRVLREVVADTLDVDAEDPERGRVVDREMLELAAALRGFQIAS